MTTAPAAPERRTRRSAEVVLRDDRGSSAVEYALIIGLVALVMSVGAALLGTSVSSGFASAAEHLGNASGMQDAQSMAAPAVGDEGDDPEAAAEQAIVDQEAADAWAVEQEAKAAEKAAEEAQEAAEQAAEEAQEAAEKAAEESKKAEKKAAKAAKCAAKGATYQWNDDSETCRRVKKVQPS